ncbi:hypothetical protein Tco_1418926, partial [Tanacetum coccineum]
EERIKKFTGVLAHIQNICGEISGSNQQGGKGGSILLKKFEEFQDHLQELQKEKSQRLNKVFEHLITLLGWAGWPLGTAAKTSELGTSFVEFQTTGPQSWLAGMEKQKEKKKNQEPQKRKEKGSQIHSIGTNIDAWQGPAPWDSLLVGDGCPKFLCDVMVVNWKISVFLSLSSSPSEFSQVEGLAKHLRCVGIDAAVPYSIKPETNCTCKDVCLGVQAAYGMLNPEELIKLLKKREFS